MANNAAGAAGAAPALAARAPPVRKPGSFTYDVFRADLYVQDPADNHSDSKDSGGGGDDDDDVKPLVEGNGHSTTASSSTFVHKQPHLRQAVTYLRHYDIAECKRMQPIKQTADGVLRRAVADFTPYPLLMRWSRRDVSKDFIRLMSKANDLRRRCGLNANAHGQAAVLFEDATHEEEKLLAADGNLELIYKPHQPTEFELEAYFSQMIPLGYCVENEKLFLLYPFMETTPHVVPTLVHFRKLLWWVRMLHQAGFVISDIAPRNIIWSNDMIPYEYASCVRINKHSHALLPLDISTEWMLNRRRARSCDDYLGLASVAASFGLVDMDDTALLSPHFAPHSSKKGDCSVCSTFLWIVCCPVWSCCWLTNGGFFNELCCWHGRRQLDLRDL